jgi:hypothetical protein
MKLSIEPFNFIWLKRVNCFRFGTLIIMGEVFKIKFRLAALLFLVIQIIAINQANAQSNRSVYLDYSYGLSSPLGDFASRNFNNEEAGFAKGGLSSSFTIGYDFIDKGFGFLFKTQSHVNVFNAVGYQRELNKTTTGYWTAYGDNYVTSSLMLGAKKNINLTPKSTLDFRALLGLAICKTPEIEAFESSLPYWFVELPTYASTLGYQLGLGYQYQVNKRLSLIASFEYFGAAPEFGDITSYASSGSIFSDTRSQKMNVVNTRIGIGINLN